MGKFKVKNIGFLLLALVFVACSCVWFSTHAGKSYSDVMRRAKSGNPNFANSAVYDIAMLGSHDAMSDKINTSSAVDYSGDVPEDLVGWLKLRLVKSIAVNYSRTQSVSLSEQLKAGVRYIDGRLTCNNGTYRATHGLVSGTLEGYLKEIITFLLDNPGEFVVFHIAYFDAKERTENQLAEYMQTVKVRRNGIDYNIYDFVNYDTSKDFSKVTYNDVTKNGQRGGVIFVTKFKNNKITNSSLRRYFNNKSYNSTWYNKSSSKELLSMVDATVAQYKGVKAFRCNGLQTTQNGTSIALHLFGSLIKNAKSENVNAISHPNFDYWLTCMPIVCFDEVVSTNGDFNSKVNDKILNYNLNLNKAPAKPKYNKITSTSQLKDGMKIVIKGVNSTNGYWGNDFKSAQVGKYSGGQFTLDDKPNNMWTLKKSGNGWKIKMPDGNYLDRNLFGYLVKTKKESSAVTFKFNFTSSGTVKVYYDIYGMYIDSKNVLDLSKKRADVFEVYG